MTMHRVGGGFGRGWRARFGGALGLAILVNGCAPLHAPRAAPGEQPFDEIRKAPYASQNPLLRSVEKLPLFSRRAEWFWLAKLSPPRPLPPLNPIDPDLTAAVRGVPGTTPETVVVTFRDHVQMPRFPHLNPTLRRDAPTNKVRILNAHTLIQQIVLARAPVYLADTTLLQTGTQAHVLQTFWVVQACVAVIPAQNLTPAQLGDSVVYVRLDKGRPPPGHDGEPGNDVITARARIGTDAYFDAFGDGLVALLDTGVHTRHVLLHAPTNLCMVADLFAGLGLPIANESCSAFDPQTGATDGGGDLDPRGHGTSSAAILVGNDANVPPGSSNYGRFRGVTRASLDCFQVYGTDGVLHVGAALQGFELALARLDDVIVCEMQENSIAHIADIEAAADHAYDQGRLVIAANGNDATLGIGVPARARLALGVGAYHIQYSGPLSGQAHGTTSDGRIKPDLIAPSYTETAGDLTDDDMHYHPGTSGATPYAAGAAVLLQNWMRSRWPETQIEADPGQVYAQMIVAGDLNGPFAAASSTGAGKIRLPDQGLSLYGKTWVTAATSQVDVPIDVPAGVGRVSAAIWWPEHALIVGGVAVDTHNDVDLEIVSPGIFGTVQATSNGGDGVFERATVVGTPVARGRWIVRIKPYAMRTPAPQIVYWAVAMEP